MYQKVNPEARAARYCGASVDFESLLKTQNLIDHSSENDNCVLQITGDPCLEVTSWAIATAELSLTRNFKLERLVVV
jgi:hypothetical protein